jgi:prephenate dehydratase
LIEEPFTALTDIYGKTPLLPLTEICRTIRRDVRAIAQYSQLARQCGAPTIQRAPRVLTVPEGFKELREMFKAAAEKTAAEKAAAEKAAAEKAAERAAAEKAVAEKAAAERSAAETDSEIADLERADAPNANSKAITDDEQDQ